MPLPCDCRHKVHNVAGAQHNGSLQLRIPRATSAPCLHGDDTRGVQAAVVHPALQAPQRHHLVLRPQLDQTVRKCADDYLVMVRVHSAAGNCRNAHAEAGKHGLPCEQQNGRCSSNGRARWPLADFGELAEGVVLASLKQQPRLAACPARGALNLLLVPAIKQSPRCMHAHPCEPSAPSFRVQTSCPCRHSCHGLPLCAVRQRVPSF
jgi:hypothetical protein